MNPYRYDIQTLERKARAVRRHIVRLNANSPAGGHTGADLSQVELLTALYFRVLNVAPNRLDDRSRDIYIQSKRPSRRGAATTASWRKRLLPGRVAGDLPACQFPSPRPPGAAKTRRSSSTPARWATVCLLPVGLALAAKKSNSTRRIFLITGDGELAEGSNWGSRPGGGALRSG